MASTVYQPADPRIAASRGRGRVLYWPQLLDEDIRTLVSKMRRERGRLARVFPYNRHQFEHEWTKARHKANWTVPGSRELRWRFHDLRHFYCSWALSKDGLGLEVANVSKLAGHASPEFTYRTSVRSRPGLHDRVRQAGKRAATREPGG